MEFEPLNYTPFLPVWLAIIVMVAAMGFSFVAGCFWIDLFSENSTFKDRKKARFTATRLTFLAIVFIPLAVAGGVSLGDTDDKVNDGYAKNLSVKYDTESFRYEFPRDHPEDAKNGKIFKIRLITDTAVVEARTSYDPVTGEPFLYDYIDGSASSVNQNFSVTDLEK